jgi:hypothetical protein
MAGNRELRSKKMKSNVCTFVNKIEIFYFIRDNSKNSRKGKP